MIPQRNISLISNSLMSAGGRRIPEARVESTREIGDQKTCEKRFYISSMLPDSRALARAIRSHWGIENQLHWCLDMTFNEDGCRVRTGNAAENFNVVRKIAMNLLKINTSRKLRNVAKKCQFAGINDRYLAEVLGLQA